MALTTLDPKTALVIIDLQLGIIAYQTAHPSQEIVQRAAQLAAAFRRHGLPVVLVNVDGGAPGRVEQRRAFTRPDNWAVLAPELNAQPQDIKLTKTTWGVFTTTDLHQRLKDLGVTQVVLSGISTSVGVESTARQAFEHGYNVTLAIDAMTDTNADAHLNSITRIFPRLGETGSTQEIVDLLDRLHAK